MRNNIKQKGRRFSSQPKNKKRVSTIDPNQLIKRASNDVESTPEFKPTKTFAELYLDQRLVNNLEQKGYKNPTEIQEKAIKPLVEGRNMVGIANTGTGKTAAFLLPIIDQLLSTDRHFTSLVIVPTRELAQQVEEEFRSFTKGFKFYVSTFIGGTNVDQDVRRLKKFQHVIVGTPGRLIDLSDRGALRLEKVNTLVLDEFDRMLDMGFVNDIKKIVGRMNARKQTMLFSATLDKSQQSIIDELVSDPIEIKTTTGTKASEMVDQEVIKVKEGEDKFAMLKQLIDGEAFKKVIIFAETKRAVDKLSKKLKNSGVNTVFIHGGKTQNFRSKAIQQFKKGPTKVLVATDVAARGIDVDNVSHVINYQLPATMDSYVHRIGRTGRAGKKGMAYTFVD